MSRAWSWCTACWRRNSSWSVRWKLSQAVWASPRSMPSDTSTSSAILSEDQKVSRFSTSMPRSIKR
jgi:hypothetical protein